MKSWPLLLVMTIGLGTIANTEEVHPTGMELFEMCTKSANLAGEAACQAYIYGFAQGYEASSLLSPKACIPGEANYGQIRLVFEKYMRDHPEILDKPAV